MKNRVMAAFLVFWAAVAASGTVIIDENFTDEESFLRSWAATLSGEYMSYSVGNGTITVNNTSNRLGDIVYDPSAGAIPQTFTLSFVIKPTSARNGGAGMLFCKQVPDKFNAYFITTIDNEVVVYLMEETTESIVWNPIFNKTNYDFNQNGDNKLTVSGNGSKFVVFANDNYLGEFTNTRFGEGYVSLFAANGATAAFGSVHLTDVFTDGAPSNVFSDDFENGDLRYWKHYGSPTNNSVQYTAANGVLNVNTDNGAIGWIYIDMDLDNFTARVEARHLAGTEGAEYGFVLLGEAAAGQSIPMVHFAVNGARKSAVWTSPSSMGSPNQTSSFAHTALNGALIAKADTLEIKRVAGSQTYEFYGNDAQLNVTYPTVNFKIVGIGVFSYGELNVAFDNFYVERIDGTTSIAQDTRNRVTQKRPGTVRPHNPVFYDLKGRRSYSTARTNGRVPSRTATGVYVNENQKDALVRKRK